MGLRTLGWAQRIPNQTSWSSSIMPLGGPSPSCESRTSAYNRATRCRELEHEQHVDITISRCRMWQRRERCLNCHGSTTKESAGNDNAVIVGERAQVAAFWPVEGADLHGDKRIWRDPTRYLRKRIRCRDGGNKTLADVAAYFFRVWPAFALVRRPNIGEAMAVAAINPEKVR